MKYYATVLTIVAIYEQSHQTGAVLYLPLHTWRSLPNREGCSFFLPALHRCLRLGYVINRGSTHANRRDNGVTGVLAAGYGGSLDTRNVQIFGLCGGGSDRENINVLMLFVIFFQKTSPTTSA
jgi:hypothetical protein